MKLQLDLSQDADLRKSIKRLIEEQVKAIAREEFEKFLREELARKVKDIKINHSQYDLNDKINAKVNQAVDEMIGMKVKERLSAVDLDEKVKTRINDRVDNYTNEHRIQDVINKHVQLLISNLSKIN